MSDRNKAALGREERVIQVMALSVNGVCMDGDGNGEGQGRVGLEVYILLVQDKSCFSQGSIYL
jgi:hypothetical protein